MTTPLLRRAIVLLCTVSSLIAQTRSTPDDFKTLQSHISDPAHPLTWVMTGDSITQGAKWLGPARSYPELFEETVRWQLQRRRDIFINTAISGERTDGLLGDFDWRVRRFRPDVVSLMIGMNDAVAGKAGRVHFETNLRKLVSAIRELGAIPILHRTNSIDEGGDSAQLRSDLTAYNQIIREVAIGTDTILVDHWSFWQEQRPTLEARRAWLADPIHPNAVGHAALANTLLETLKLEPISL